jgi:hypothetical protein
MELRIKVSAELMQNPLLFKEYAAFLERIESLQHGDVPREEYVPIPETKVKFFTDYLTQLPFPSLGVFDAHLGCVVKLLHCFHFHQYSLHETLRDNYVKDLIKTTTMVMLAEQLSQKKSQGQKPRERTRKRPTFGDLPKEEKIPEKSDCKKHEEGEQPIPVNLIQQSCSFLFDPKVQAMFADLMTNSYKNKSL